jgi:hypothetical protein
VTRKEVMPTELRCLGKGSETSAGRVPWRDPGPPPSEE